MFGPRGIGNRGGGGRHLGLWLRGEVSVGIWLGSLVNGGGLGGRRDDRPVRLVLAAGDRLPRLLEKSGHPFAAHVPALVRARLQVKLSRKQRRGRCTTGRSKGTCLREGGRSSFFGIFLTDLHTRHKIKGQPKNHRLFVLVSQTARSPLAASFDEKRRRSWCAVLRSLHTE